MGLIELSGVTLAYGGRPLFEGADLQVEAGERLCLLGRNGTGKSSLLRVIEGVEAPDAGQRTLTRGTRVACLGQEIPGGICGRVGDLVTDPEGAPVREDWEIVADLDRLARGLDFDPEGTFETLSGGMKRRVMLGRALFQEPDLLLLDEPTNHLDIEAIRWLEETLLGFRGAVFFITHDRRFLRRVATRILELDRGSLTSWDCNYETFLKRKEAWLEAEARQWQQEDKKLAQEEAWLRKGIKARRTRNEGRVRALQRLRAERSGRRDRLGTARLGLQEVDRSGDKVLEATGLGFAWEGGGRLFGGLDLVLRRGDKIGVMGRNGSGKTTLLKVLLGELAPTEGTIEYGTRLEVVYLDQLRGAIDENATLAENVAGDAETVWFNGASRHIHSYLRDFLFPPDRIHGPASRLSGGERNRLLLAKLFLRPANVLVLDEPTNDLDTETLELLEDLLSEFDGTLLLVSHDRDFIDNLVTGLLVLDGSGTVREVVGGYSDYEREMAGAKGGGKSREADTWVEKKGRNVKPRDRGPRLLNRDREELEGLPGRIERFETEQGELAERLADPVVVGDLKRLGEVEMRLGEIEEALKRAYARWEELEALREAAEGKKHHQAD